MLPSTDSAATAYRGTSVADIARDAGVSGTAAYAYFDNKKALFLAALDDDAASAIRSGHGHRLRRLLRALAARACW